MAQAESDEPRLDAEELMHLALKAMERNRHDDALLFLKHAIAEAPEDGRLHHLLGALHAEVGMTERAIREITRATELSPGLSTAHFQLGLLHVAMADVEQAQEAWAPLDQLGENDALRIFKGGMVHFLNEEYEEAIAWLKRGIELNEASESLNDDMQLVIEQAQAARSEQASKDKAVQ